jgi:hypothetical protein
MILLVPQVLHLILLLARSLLALIHPCFQSGNRTPVRASLEVQLDNIPKTSDNRRVREKNKNKHLHVGVARVYDLCLTALFDTCCSFSMTNSVSPSKTCPAITFIRPSSSSFFNKWAGGVGRGDLLLILWFASKKNRQNSTKTNQRKQQTCT